MRLHTSLVIGAGLWLGLGAARADIIDVTFSGQVLDHPEPGVVADHTGAFGTPVPAWWVRPTRPVCASMTAWHASMRREPNPLGGDFRVLIYDDSSADQGLYLYALSSRDFMGGSIDLRQCFSYSFQPGDVVGQTFNIHNFNHHGFKWARGMLDVRTLTVSSVPEPASALLLAAGRLALGAGRGKHLRP